MKFAILLVFVNQIDTSLAKEPRNSKVCKFQFSTHVLLTYFLKYENKNYYYLSYSTSFSSGQISKWCLYL